MYIKSISIIAKQDNREAERLARVVEHMLKTHGVQVYNPGIFLYTHEHVTRLAQSDLVLVLGGDGTIIRVARALVGTNTPVAGINLGGVGFLAELTTENWSQALQKAITEGFSVEKRLALHISVLRQIPGYKKTTAAKNTDGADTFEFFSGYAVNDVVLSRGGIARLLALDVTIDGEHAAFWRADGIIVSTGTGSTGYTGSAGGPLLAPGLDAYVVTAICPFLSRAMPLVLSGKSSLTLTVRSACANSFVTLDGQDFMKLKVKDKICVRGLHQGVTFANFDTASYFDKLRSSGLLQDSGGIK